MTRSDRGPFRRGLALAVVALALAADAHAQGRTDVVTLANGDRITGEVMRLERGRLEFKTDDAGTLQLEWDKLASLVAARLFEVVTTDGGRFLGTLNAAGRRAILVQFPGGESSLPMAEVTGIAPIGTSFWRKLDGSIDLGFNYTRSSGVAQLNFDWRTVYRRAAFEAGVSASATAIQNNDGTGRDDRGAIDVSYLRFPWRRWFLGAAGRFESNESLGIRLRSQIAGAVGPRLVNSNRGQLSIGGGLVVNDERGVDVEPTQNLEALLVFRSSFYTYDRPRTNLDIGLDYYPSLSDPGRHRLQVDAGVKREFWKDLFVNLSMYNSFDSRPPNPTADSNDVGVVLSIGWSY